VSHSSGTVTFNDGIVFWFEYNGTSDYAVSDIYPTEEEMHDNWRKGERKKCTCGNLEPVVIHTNYAGGIDWEGEACRTCKAINHEHLRYDWKEEKEYRNGGYWGYGIN